MPRSTSRTSRRRATTEPARRQTATSAQRGDTPRAAASFPIVGIGASAGGLEAFRELLTHLPIDTGMGFVLVQHLDPDHESALPNLLSRATTLPVHEVTNNLQVEPNHIYVIPPNRRMGIHEGALTLGPRPGGRTPARSIDAFFEALAEDQREWAIGVILSGTASDGTMGLEAIKAEGGITFAQDDSAKYDSMPRSAVAAGCVDFVLSPKQIANELAQIAKHPAVVKGTDGSVTQPEDDRASAIAHEDDDTALPSGGHGSPATGAARARGEAAAHAEDEVGAEGFKKILLLLRSHSGADFSLYKSSTIRRRITRRMVLSRQNRLDEYAQFLRGNSKELDALYSDVLISVTSFFRNPETFDVLQRKVWPQLLKQRGDEPLRVWVLGCSTGQEAYSIAMTFVEAADKAPRMRTLQVFATDLNEALLDKARHGLYAKSVAQDVSPERLRRFFVEEEGGYRITKALREKVVFARQNVVIDPPFSRMDVISCRNLLIYFEPGLQRRLFPVFHYSLRPGGFLCLGASESIGGFTNLFEPADKKHKIYMKKLASTSAFQLPTRKDRGGAPAPRPDGTGRSMPLQADTGREVDDSRAELSAQREADRITVNEFAPPAVLVNADLQVLQFRGPTGAYLEPPKGKASFDVLKMARSGLMLPLRSAINKAKKDNKTARKEHVRIDHDGASRVINLEVIPLKNLREPGFLIVFEDVGASAGPADQASRRVSRSRARMASAPGGRARRGEESRRLADVESELAETRDYLQSIQEQHEAASEELQASNEEVQSANEELQSINEELETSKEELESANEELITVNEEMANRNAELARLNSDLVNIQTSAQQAIVLLARDLTIRRFSAQAEKRFNLLAADVGRPFGALRHAFDLPDLDALIAGVIDTVRAAEREVQDRDGHWFSLRVQPYLSHDNKVDGAVLVLVDIDTLKRNESVLTSAREYAENIIETVREPLLVLDAGLRVEHANRAFYKTFTATPADTVSRLIYDLGNRHWNIDELRSLLEEVVTKNSSINDYSVTLDVGQLGRRTMLLNARRMHNPEHRSDRILLAIEDVTDRRVAENEVTVANRRKDEFLAMLAHELRNPLAPIRYAIERMRTGRETDSSHSPLDVLDRQVGHMARLVDDLLDASRISRGTVELRRQPVELSSVIGLAVEAARPFCDSLGHQLTVTLPPASIFLYGDATRLAQIVGNLLNNACKFTERGGRVWLSVERDGVAEIVIRVRDTGLGISAEHLPLVFNLFTRLDTSLERAQTGLGIGLTLVKILAEMHGGDVQANSSGLGHGSEFVVRLPIVMDAPADTAPMPSVPPVETMPSLRILVADDNRDSVESLVELLRIRGHETFVAHNGLEAVETAARLQPDVILLDIGMPGLNGHDAARRIREQQGDRRPVLVALTGWGQDEYRQRSAAAGFDAHIVKPVKDTVLLQAIYQARRP